MKTQVCVVGLGKCESATTPGGKVTVTVGDSERVILDAFAMDGKLYLRAQTATVHYPEDNPWLRIGPLTAEQLNGLKAAIDDALNVLRNYHNYKENGK